MRLLVTSAAGRVGKEVVARVRQALPNAFIRCACRRPEKAEFLKTLGANEVLQFEYTDASTYDAALAGGVDAIFSSSPDPALKGHEAFCKYLEGNAEAQKSLKHIVRLSCFGAEANTAIYDLDKHVSAHSADPASKKKAKVPHMLEGYWLAEKYCLDACKNPAMTQKPQVTAVRGNFFMSHLMKPDVENIKSEGWFKLPFGDARNSYVSTNDMGEIAALALLGGAEKYGDKFYDITGPVPQSMHEVAADLGKAMKENNIFCGKCEYRPSDQDQFVKDFGQTRWEFIEYLLNGFYCRVSPDFYNLTGRRPTTYYEHLTQKGAAGENGLDELFNAPSMWTKGVDLFKEEAAKKAAEDAAKQAAAA